MTLRLTFEPLFPETTLYAILFRNVSNAAKVRKSLLAGELEVGLIDASMLLDIPHLEAAALHVLQSEATKTLTTNNIHAELVFALSGSHNIRNAFQLFGLTEESEDVVVCLWNPSMDQVARMEAGGLIEGTIVPLDSDVLTDICDSEKLCKYMKIGQDELSISSLSCAVVGRVATRGAFRK